MDPYLAPKNDNLDPERTMPGQDVMVRHSLMLVPEAKSRFEP